MVGYPKVVSVVVTYNRLGELQKTINSLLSQTVLPQVVYVVNNASADGTQEYLEMVASLNRRVIPINLDANTGGAGGFATGLRLAIENTDCDWIWLMDDDGRPENAETLALLLEEAKRVGEPCILNSCVLDPATGDLAFPLPRYRSLREMPAARRVEGCAPFNGTLVARKIVESIGYPRKDFFIRWDEREYYIRAIKHGFKSYTVLESRFLHPAPKRIELSLPWGSLAVTVESPLKAYYGTRNAIVTGWIHFGIKGMIGAALKYGVGSLVIGLLFMDDRLRRARSILKGVFDGLIWCLRGANTKPEERS